MSDTLAWRSARLITLRHWLVVRHGNPWSVPAEGIFEPFLYLMSIGVGIGTLVGSYGKALGGGYSYASFVAPALLAMAAMNTAANETIWGTWYRLELSRFYDSIVATPLSPADIAAGECAAATLRGGFGAACFLLVEVLLGFTHSRLAALAVPGVVLIAFAFASAGIAVATFMKQLHHNQYVQLVMLPMFLFSATFYPLSIYPWPIRDAVSVLPLYQSTVLLRGFCLGRAGSGQVVAVVYLAVMGAASLALASRRLGRLLVH